MKTSNIYQIITDLRQEGHSVASLCRLMEVSQSGYFESLHRPPSQREQRRAALTQKLIQVFDEHKNRYGRPRIYQQLKAQGEEISEKMVGSIIRAEGLKTRKKRPFRPQTTQPGKSPRYAPNLLKNYSSMTSPNMVLVSDITYLASREGWLYLAGIMDLKTKVIKGYRLEENMPTSLVTGALDQALKSDPQMKGAILHSDRGCQYTSHNSLQKLKDNDLKASMSGKGKCYENAAMESFWSTLKTECFPESGVFETKEAARQVIFEYLEGYYHTVRIHSSLNYLTPLAAELAA